MYVFVIAKNWATFNDKVITFTTNLLDGHFLMKHLKKIGLEISRICKYVGRLVNLHMSTTVFWLESSNTKIYYRVKFNAPLIKLKRLPVALLRDTSLWAALPVGVDRRFYEADSKGDSVVHRGVSPDRGRGRVWVLCRVGAGGMGLRGSHGPLVG